MTEEERAEALFEAECTGYVRPLRLMLPGWDQRGPSQALQPPIGYRLDRWLAGRVVRWDGVYTVLAAVVGCPPEERCRLARLQFNDDMAEAWGLRDLRVKEFVELQSFRWTEYIPNSPPEVILGYKVEEVDFFLSIDKP